MISCVEWVPQGVADPNPKAYELSTAEKELLENQAQLEQALNENDSDEDDDEPAPTSTTTTTILPKIDPKSLPPELRMDEYSSDEGEDDDDNQVMRGSAIGKLLVGNDSDVEEDDETMTEQVKNEDDGSADDWEDEDEDSDDDLEDIPDTREFVPTDLEGLQAMGLSHVGAGAAMNLEQDNGEEEDDDNDSDADDIHLSPDDAIIVVAKTEEVWYSVVRVCAWLGILPLCILITLYK